MEEEGPRRLAGADQIERSTPEKGQRGAGGGARRRGRCPERGTHAAQQGADPQAGSHGAGRSGRSKPRSSRLPGLQCSRRSAALRPLPPLRSARSAGPRPPSTWPAGLSHAWAGRGWRGVPGLAAGHAPAGGEGRPHSPAPGCLQPPETSPLCARAWGVQCPAPPPSWPGLPSASPRDGAFCMWQQRSP